jgi:hypothetical protein
MLFVADSWYRSVKVAKAFKLLQQKVDNGSNDDSKDNNIEYSYAIDKEQGDNLYGHEVVK